MFWTVNLPEVLRTAEVRFCYSTTCLHSSNAGI